MSEAGAVRGAARLTVLCDVRTAFEDAARVFGAQKGASEDEVRLLSDRLGRVARDSARDPRGVPMTGAAGGLAGGLWAEFDAELVSGAVFVLNAVGYDARMRAARAVVTGEGRLDRRASLARPSQRSRPGPARPASPAMPSLEPTRSSRSTPVSSTYSWCWRQAHASSLKRQAPG